MNPYYEAQAKRFRWMRWAAICMASGTAAAWASQSAVAITTSTVVSVVVWLLAADSCRVRIKEIEHRHKLHDRDN